MRLWIAALLCTLLLGTARGQRPQLSEFQPGHTHDILTVKFSPEPTDFVLGR